MATAAAFPPRRQAADVTLAAALTALSVLIITTLPRMPWPAYALALAHTIPLAFRRRAPMPAVIVAVSAALAFGLAGYPMVGLGPAGIVWLYSVGAEIDRPRSLGILVLAELVLVVMVRGGNQGDASTLIGDAIVLAVAYLLGDSARRRRQLLALYRERAEQLERTHEEVAKRAVAEERLRIARELHDVVAHSMSLIAVQAGTGRLAVESDPRGASEALTVIEQTTRDALAEMRRLLGVLRRSDEDDPARAPAPTLDIVDDLIARARAGGVPVTYEVRGRATPLPAGMELAAYRILQEALTNVARHAPGASTGVVVTYGEEHSRSKLTIEVANSAGSRTATPSDEGGAGLGIAGMRERAQLYNGTVDAGPLPGGGFRVRAELCCEPGRLAGR